MLPSTIPARALGLVLRRDGLDLGEIHEGELLRGHPGRLPLLVHELDHRRALCRESHDGPELAVLVQQAQDGRTFGCEPSVDSPNFARTFPLWSTMAMLAEPSENRPKVARTFPSSSAMARPADPSS